MIMGIVSGLFVFLNLFFNLNTAYSDQSKISHYLRARHIFWDLKFNQDTNSLYCDKSVKRRKGFNIEHVFAASWMKEAAGCKNSSRKKCRLSSSRFNFMESDLHNLYPAIPKVNARRGDLPFLILDGSSNNTCDFEFEWHGIEPSPKARGPIARALLYMSHEYNVDLDEAASSPGLTDLVESWHCTYPVQNSEVERNEEIYSVQNTLNPFISDPKRVNCLEIKLYPED